MQARLAQLALSLGRECSPAAVRAMVPEMHCLEKVQGATRIGATGLRASEREIYL